MKHALYEVSSGKIISIVSATNDLSSTVDDLAYVEFDVDGVPENYFVEGGAIKRKSDSQLNAESLQRAWTVLRRRRNSMLAQCDWTQVPDAPVDRAAWAAYRQALRDLPANTDDPRDPQWPSPPQ